MKYSNEGLSRKFGQEGATEGEGSNMFIRGDTVYSYGEHFKIAIRLNVKQAFATNVKFVFNSEGFQQATAKQKAYVRRYLQSYIELPDCNLDEKYLRKYLNDLKIEVDEIRNKQLKLKEKGKRFYQLESKIAKSLDRIKEVENFIVGLYGGQAVHFIKEDD